MYENTNNSVDWKGLFLKVIIAFLIVLIAIVGYKTLKGNDKKENILTTTTKIADSNASSTFSANIEKLKKAGESYYNKNKDKLPKNKDVTTMVTLNELIKNGEITALSDQNGKNCDGESSYVTAILEGNKTKIKANLVCGESSSYSIVYLGENDNETKNETITQTSNNGNNKVSSTSTYSSSSNTSTNSNTSNSKCTTTSCTPQVNITNTTEVENNISINKGNESTNNNTKPNTRSFTVSFDANGGTKYFRNQFVNEYDKAYNPGNNYKSGYKFKGWYLDGKLFDFNTPITRDIELVARYTKTSYIEDEDDYRYNSSNLKVDYETSYVYTMGWFENGTEQLQITHTLRLPEAFEDIDNVKDVKISNIEFVDGITAHSEAETYSKRHRDTFIYDYDENEVWHSDTDTTNSLATIIEKNVRFDISKSDSYVDIDDAEDDGFEVTWRTLDVKKQCKNPFSVNGITNRCNYGIVYKVTWQYRYYA